LRNNVDTLLIICNDKLREMYGNLKMSEAFSKADDILTVAAKGIAEIITVAGYINVDFEDVKTVMKDGGTAIMGSASAEGTDRAIQAVTKAMASPLLNDNEIKGAKYILLNITSGDDEISMDEIDSITEYIQEEAGNTADIIWGNGIDETLGAKVSVTIVATGFGSKSAIDVNFNKEPQRVVRSLTDEVPTNMTQQVRGEEKKEEEPKDSPNEPYLKTSESQVSFEFEIKKPQPRQMPTPEPEMKRKPEPEIIRHTLDEEMDSANDDSTRDDTMHRKTVSDEEQMRRAHERILKLKSLNLKMKTPGGINDLENEPAYKRRNIRLDSTPHSSESNVSRYTLSEDEDKKTTLRQNNSFLHDNVD
jgi:cell division protein FtsZ